MAGHGAPPTSQAHTRRFAQGNQAPHCVWCATPPNPRYTRGRDSRFGNGEGPAAEPGTVPLRYMPPSGINSHSPQIARADRAAYSTLHVTIFLLEDRMATPLKVRVKKRRDTLRLAGLRPVQIWVPDTRRPDFAEECRRQCQLVAKADSADTHQLMSEALADVEGWTE